ncbi:hypothetical protein ACHAWO_005533 [Cyclotella atomus]|uniref:Uncharacterized protein n=1 Tax=Cyclotella atomus TaxID=382360 RepID=A0ABD3NZ32_9STRA
MSTDTPSGGEQTPSEPRRRGRQGDLRAISLLEIVVPLLPEAEAVQQEVPTEG